MQHSARDLARKLEGAFQPKDYRTKSRKFRNKKFAQTYALGQTVFYAEGSCATCHRDHGEGIVRIYPPLAGSEWVNGDPDRLIKLTLHGVWGEIQVRGKVFEPSRGVPPMTAIGNMFTDAEIAAVLTYVRNSWGNDADAISPADVKRVRAETIDRRRFYSPEELIEMHPFPEGSRPALVEEGYQNSELEKALLAEPLVNLVSDAWKHGDPKRGAKLFYAEKTACASCHDANTNFQLGPKLTEPRKEATEEFLIQSILKPSDSILNGYRSVTVFTADGTIVSGYLVAEDEKQLTISVAAEQGKRREISIDDVDELVESKVSTMPAGLANLIQGRDEFLDLARFVLEVNRDGQRKLRVLKRQVSQVGK